MCKPILALVSDVLSHNNESLCKVQTVRHPALHPVLRSVYQTNVVEQWTRTQSQLGSIKAQASTNSGKGKSCLLVFGENQGKRNLCQS